MSRDILYDGNSNSEIYTMNDIMVNTNMQYVCLIVFVDRRYLLSLVRYTYKGIAHDYLPLNSVGNSAPFV